MEEKLDLVWTVVESSDFGDTLVGVFSTLARAQASVAALAGKRYEDYRIEGHVLDEGKNEPTPWLVNLARDGRHLGTTPFVGCSCSDDEAEYRRLSYVSDGGDYMSVIVFASTPGHAIRTAERYRAWLHEHDFWGTTALQIEPLYAEL